MKKLLILASAMIFATCTLSAQDSAKQDKMSHGKMERKMKDCVMMKDGKMMVWKDGQKMDMTEDMTMTNGTTVTTDGSMKTKDGKTTALKNGDCVFMDGKMMKMHSMKSKM